MVSSAPNARNNREAIATTGAGSLANLAAITQVITSAASLGVLVSGLLGMGASGVGIFLLRGSSRVRTFIALVLLLAVSSGATGFALAGYRHQAQGGPSNDPPATGASPGTVVNEGEVLAHTEDRIDLEAGKAGNGVSGADILYSFSAGPTNAYLGVSNSPYMAPVPQRPTSEQCADALETRHDDSERIAEGGAGGWYCVRTDENNVSAIQVRTLPATPGDAVTIAYTTWSD